MYKFPEWESGAALLGVLLCCGSLVTIDPIVKWVLDTTVMLVRGKATSDDDTF